MLTTDIQTGSLVSNLSDAVGSAYLLNFFYRPLLTFDSLF